MTRAVENSISDSFNFIELSLGSRKNPRTGLGQHWLLHKILDQDKDHPEWLFSSHRFSSPLSVVLLKLLLQSRHRRSAKVDFEPMCAGHCTKGGDVN